MIKAVIFDLDGVIVSTDELHYLAWKKIADLEGIIFNKEINDRLRGISRLASLNIILENARKTYTQAEKEKLAEIKNDYYKTLLKQLSKKDILENVVEVLNILKDKGIKIAIGSSSRNAKNILKQINLIDQFEAIADGTDIKNSKPAPDVFLVAAEKLKIDPKYCMVVEDATAGIEAAKNAGMIAVAIHDATSSDLADIKLNNLNELLTYI